MEISQDISQLQQLVRQGKRVLPRGGGSKPALSTPTSDCLSVSLASITGITAYSPEEYTITALAGTPLKEVQQALQQHQQYLPFDPPLAAYGATLGGAVASGLNGPGRYRYGGMRDFLLAIQMIDGLGRLVKGGGKVVKNAAGFDLPKLMIGSLGRLGILLELTFKVFPVPEAYATLKKEFVDLSEALELYWKFHNIQLDIDSLDLDLSNDKITLWVRIGGLKEAIQQREGKLAHFIGSGETFYAGEDTQIWENKRNFTWVPPGWLLVKVTLTPSRIPEFEAAIHEKPDLKWASRSFSSGGQQVWVALPNDQASMDAIQVLLTKLNLSGLVVKGSCSNPILGRNTNQPFTRRVKTALDPDNRFLEV